MLLKMHTFWLILALLVVLLDVSLAKKKKLDLDFEFVDKIENGPKSDLKKKQWIHDPNNELCQPLNCKKRELCLLEDPFTAVCVSKTSLHKNRDEIISMKPKKMLDSNTNSGPKFSDEIYLTDDLGGDSSVKKCKTCSSKKQSFICGSDNRTYSSLCRMDYHNCVHNTAVKSSCKGFCPCKDAHSMECQPQELNSIGNRLLDWFSVIMADSKKQKRRMAKSKVHYPAACKMEAKWMFGHLDLNNDGLLTNSELYDLEHDQNERCIKPFIDTCDLDANSVLTPREWCRCFEKTDRPCAAIRRRLKSDPFDGYIPDCDIQGFYRPTQCHTKMGICWCVDKHGIEFDNTRTRGRPVCGKTISPNADKELKSFGNIGDYLLGNAKLSEEVTKNAISQPSDDEDDDLDYDENDEGSANGPISY